MRQIGLAVKRLEIAEEIIRRAETVTLLSVTEVRNIYKRAIAGEFDNIFEDSVFLEC